MFKDQKPGTTARPLADKTPLPNRIGTTLFQTPFTQKKEDLKSENDDDFDEIEFMAPNTLGKTQPFHLYSFLSLGYLFYQHRFALPATA